MITDKRKTSKHPTLLLMDFFHLGTKSRHYKKATQFLQENMNTEVYAVQSYGGQRLVMSDQEKALVKALKEGFTSSEHGEPVQLLCKIHLEGNLKRYLDTKTNKNMANTICHAVFGTKGLVDSTSRGEFEDAVLEFNKKYGEYFDDNRKETLLNNLWDHVIEPMIHFPEIQTDSTTNRNESTNAATRSLVQYTPKPYDEMVTVCGNRVSTQVNIFQ